MEVIDREKAARVWQRVRGTGIPTDGGQSLRQLICEEQTDSAALQRLSYRFRGRQARLLRQLAEDERAHASCLKGILLQTEGSCPPINTVPPPLERTDSLLRRCCDRQQRRLKEYEAGLRILPSAMFTPVWLPRSRPIALCF